MEPKLPLYLYGRVRQLCLCSVVANLTLDIPTMKRDQRGCRVLFPAKKTFSAIEQAPYPDAPMFFLAKYPPQCFDAGMESTIVHFFATR